MNTLTSNDLLYDKMKTLQDRIIYESKVVFFMMGIVVFFLFILGAILSMVFDVDHIAVSTVMLFAISLLFLTSIGLGIYVTYLSYKHIPEGFRLKFLMKYASQEDVLVREQTASMAEDAKLWVEEDKKKRETT